ncbi:MAG: carbamoyltransferase [Dysgonamonadaceae bacterium]|jgi:carbamoyltransferase|nr:carbamoyltransferase [Dysgonamonadaceae bacterium]
MKAILGISAYYHDSAAALLIDGQMVAAAQEERFSRKKHDSSFPGRSVNYVLQEAGIKGNDILYVAFYEKPFIKFERLLEIYHLFAPKGFRSFIRAIPLWIREKLYMKHILRQELLKLDIRAKILFPEHHLSHAAGAFYPSPFDNAAILTMDGVGEWATTTIGLGNKEKITILREIHFPHSLGLLYSAFTSYCGFKVNDGEYKLMGLAPYGVASERTNRYIRLIREHLVDLREDGSFLLNPDYFEYAAGLKMTNDKRWNTLFGIPPRNPEGDIQPEYIDMAYAIQKVTEEIVLRLASTAGQLTGSANLVMSGGVALNCVANGKIEKNNRLQLWIQPAAGDAGGALGAAWAVWHIYLKEKRNCEKPDNMSGAYLGPSFSDKQVQNLILRTHTEAIRMEEETLYYRIASLLKTGKIVGWFQGRMEFGPRALGNRSILADPRNSHIQKKLNLEIKFRESFRPFAPAVLEEDASEYFDMQGISPYMLKTAAINANYRLPLPADYETLPYLDKLYQKRSLLQAITHVDFSARVQTVSKQTNPRFHSLLATFKKITGCSVLVNTSFNIHGEPIVHTPEDAYHSFMNSGMDYLVIGNWVFSKTNKNERNL